MPELPEVETVARTLLPHIRDQMITQSILLRSSALHPLSLPLSSLHGRTIIDTARRGKLLILNLDPLPNSNAPTALMAHLRMTGRLLATPADESPHPHTRCILDLHGKEGDSRLFFDDMRTFGKLIAVNPTVLNKWDFWRTLGPEPLEMTEADLEARLVTSRPVKSALLDQKVIAGIGNIYADESLFMAGISPLRPANSLTGSEVASLLSAIQSVLKLSISQCGSSIRDYRDADGNAGAFQNSFQAYGQGGKPCKRCGGPLTKIRLGNRATVYCPSCQN